MEYNQIKQIERDAINHLVNAAKAAQETGKQVSINLNFRGPEVRKIAKEPNQLVLSLRMAPYGDYTCSIRRKGSKFVWIDKEARIEREFNDLETLRWEYELPYNVITAAQAL